MAKATVNSRHFNEIEATLSFEAAPSSEAALSSEGTLSFEDALSFENALSFETALSSEAALSSTEVVGEPLPAITGSNSMETSKRQTWFVTGAGRGMGLDIAKAALDAGHAVVAAGRDLQRLKAAFGARDNLLTLKLDVTSLDEAKSAARAAADRFGGIDVLVNNAGNFYAGFFEEISPDDFRAQIETTMFGPMNVTRAILPMMRAQRSGLVIAISSTAGIEGQEFCTAYAASKFGIEGWMESLKPEVAPFGIRTMLVEPGFFRTELLSPASTKYADPSIVDYAANTASTIANWNSMNGKQGGDPVKLATALIQLAALEEPPSRFAAGADAVATFKKKARELLADASAHLELSSSLALDNA